MNHDKTSDATAALHRAVQQQQDRHDSATPSAPVDDTRPVQTGARLSLIHISEPTRPY